MVVVAIWVLVLLVVGLYVLFVVWRLRVDRRKKALDEDQTTKLSSTIARAAAVAAANDPVTREPEAPAVPARIAAASPPPASGVATVAEALSGIALPDGLAPLTSMADRGGTGDRVAFWTAVPAEVVGPAFGDELERLGYAITAIDEQTLAAQRDDSRLIAIIHRDAHNATIGTAPAFPSVPELSTVIEVWIPLT